MKKAEPKPNVLTWHYYVTTLIFGLLAYGFWSILYSFIITGREQLSIFLWNHEFFLEHIIVPGGLAKYVGDFIVQFFFRFYVGSLLLSLLLVATHWLSWLLIRKQCQAKTIAGYILSFIPALLMWYLLGNPHVSLTFAVAVILTMILILFLPRDFKKGIAYACVAVPIGYWLLGPSIIMLPIFAVFYWKGEKVSANKSLFAAIFFLLELMICMIGSSWLVPYPMRRIMFGIDYYWDFLNIPYGEIVLLLVTALLPVFVASTIKFLSGSKLFWSILCVEVIISAILSPKGYQSSVNQEMEYDMLLGMGKWGTIIKRSQQQVSLNPVCSLVNSLARQQTGQISTDQLMAEISTYSDFDQYKTKSLIISEIMFRLGMVNLSQRMAFEMMEHIPNYNKSGRAIKRLAETNIIIGEYDVALKYISLLEETLFYRNWAKKLRVLAEHPDEVEKHPVYGKMRKIYQDMDDYFFI